MLLSKQKKSSNAKAGNRLLITVNVLGSAGPMRFVVNEEELVATVIDMALKSYAREGRLPVLGSNLSDFLLYCPGASSDGWGLCSGLLGKKKMAFWSTLGNILNIIVELSTEKEVQHALSPWETIGAHGARNFLLCKNPQPPKTKEDETRAAPGVTRKGSGSWKTWINKTLSLKVASH